MKLLMFDIDGTLLDSTGIDDACFVQSFQDCFNLDIHGFEWNEVSEVTDPVLLDEVYFKLTGKQLTSDEHLSFKKHFLDLLSRCASSKPEDFAPVEGIQAFFNWLKSQDEYEVCLATGSWKRSGEIKLKAAGLDQFNWFMANADNHRSRRGIAQHALMNMCATTGTVFDHITYFGDGLWDFKTMQHLGWDFIGLDIHQTGKLALAGAKNIWTDYLEAINQLTAQDDHQT